MTEAMPELDLAIVGGGISGVYCGWRLLKGPIPSDSVAGKWAGGGTPKVALFEQSVRIGGRLLSARCPAMRDTTAEIGGMRYVYPAQKRVTALVEDVLKLPYHEQVVDEPGNIAFLRGRLLRQSQLGDPSALPYFFDPGEAAWMGARAGQGPASLIGRVLTQVMPQINAQLEAGTLRQYLETIELPYHSGGRPAKLWYHGFWNLLAKGMSPDGFTAARATVAYDSLCGNSNALDMTGEYFEFTPDVKYRMVDEGYELVPWKLAEAFKDEGEGGKIYLQRSLTGFDGVTLGDGSTGVRLDFAEGPPVTARAILLAMPRRAIELLRPEGAVLGDATFRKDLGSVSSIPLFKLFVQYDQCWWQDAGVTKGRSLTDMPMRQCYYWPVGSQGSCVPGRKKKGLVMAYDDVLNVSFWGGLDTRMNASTQSQEGDLYGWELLNRPVVTQPVEAKTYEDRLVFNWRDNSATKAMTAELHRQLMLMHGVDDAPPPRDAAYMDWSRDPYGGGVHLWNPGFNSSKYVNRMTQPVADFPCYLCGEAYSTVQTWAEGALETAEIVLRQRLGLPKADWQHV
jgi:monoamine oxidase